MSIFYVYVLFRPWDGSPFYVGKGKGSRWLTNASDGKHNRHVAFIVRKASRLKLEIPRIKIRQQLSESEAFETEIALIAAIGRGKNGPLANLTAGGEGVSNPSEESRAKMSAAAIKRMRNPEARAKISAAHKGKKLSEETCAAMSASHLNAGPYPGQLAILDKARRFRRWPMPVEVRSKMSASAKARDRSSGYSPQHKAAIRAGIADFWQRRREAGLPLKHPRRQL